MASRTTAKNIVPVYKTDDANFEAEFSRLVNRRTQDTDEPGAESVSNVRVYPA